MAPKKDKNALKEREKKEKAAAAAADKKKKEFSQRDHDDGNEGAAEDTSHESKGSEERDLESMTSKLTNLSVEDVKGKQDEEYEESDISGSESEDDEEVTAHVLRTLLASIIKDVKRKAIRAELRDCVARLNDDQIFVLCSYLQMPSTVKSPPASKSPSPDPVAQLNALTPDEEAIIVLAEKLQSESFSYEDAVSIVKVFNTIVQNVTHGNVSFPVLAAVSIEGRALNAGFKQFAPRFLFDRELSKTSYFEKPVIFDAETAKKRSPQEYFQSASLGLGSLQLPDVFFG